MSFVMETRREDGLVSESVAVIPPKPVGDLVTGNENYFKKW